MNINTFMNQKACPKRLSEEKVLKKKKKNAFNIALNLAALIIENATQWQFSIKKWIDSSLTNKA